VENTLTEPEEKIINLKDTSGRDALMVIYASLTNRYEFKDSFLPDGDGKTLNREQLSSHFRSHVPQIRAGAYQELYRVFGQDGPILGQIYQALVRDFSVENIRLRHYPTPSSVRHKYNDLPQETVDSLLRVCQKRAPEIFGRYFQKKAQALGQEKLARYDIYAPLYEDKGQWTFDEGIDIVEKCFGDFDSRMGSLARAVFKANHLDAQIRPGKRSGAFCMSYDPKKVPWVLMSYKGQTHDLFTLAHELGHAVHSQLARDNNLFHFEACLPLAETASTFGEMLLAKYLRDQVKTEEEKQALSFLMLDDAYATVGRQAFFALFEIKAHELVAQGATVDELAQAYWDNLTGQFGQSVELAPEFRWEWVYIPHIYHTPFYVYAYSFGQLLVYSLWLVYEQQGEPLAKRLINLLSRGGSAPPLTLVSEAGLGPLDDDFWSGGFDVVESFLL
jgi:oligoendopeptidase F